MVEDDSKNIIYFEKGATYEKRWHFYLYDTNFDCYQWSCSGTTKTNKAKTEKSPVTTSGAEPEGNLLEDRV